MGRLVVATPVLSDVATLTTPGTVAATLPLANLLTMQLSEPCRWTELTNVAVVADLGAAQAINFIGLFGHNGSAAAAWRVRAADTEADLTAAPAYDSGSASMWPPSGKPEADVQHSFRLLAAAVLRRWWCLDVTDAANPDGWFQAGRLYLSSAWQPARNYSYGQASGFDDPTPVDQSIGGQAWPSPRRPVRVESFTLRGLDETDARAQAWEIFRRRGRSGDVFAVFDPDADQHLHRRMIYGLIAEQGAVVNAAFRIFESSWTIRELP